MTFTEPDQAPIADDDEASPVIRARFEKAGHLAADGLDLYPNTFRPTHKIRDIRARFGDLDDFENLSEVFTLAGRVMARRDYGKSVFFDLSDSSGRLQVYLQRQSEAAFELFKKLDIGDLVGVSGRLFKTRTGELTLKPDHLELVTKALWPLPEKYHELSVELRHRRRYVDLIMNEESRRVFRLRSAIVSMLRKFLEERGFLEVETPMMHAIPGGASAKPFETYHHALNRNLFLRVAPELHLKRLLVGGFDRVFEINRSFRNEGLSLQHNPEFTALEFYQGYADFQDLMSLTEEMFTEVALEVKGALAFTYQGQPVDFARPWRRLKFHQALAEIGGVPPEVLTDRQASLDHLRELGGEKSDRDELGKVQAKIFDLRVEPKLTHPTFITHYPADISPLARRSQDNPLLTDRFELFIAGRELANAFSELNDPLDQRERFRRQAAALAAGDEEGMHQDEDYVRALMYGMPPAAGEGVGVDRLVMLLADVPSIKDVILFPHFRPVS